MPEEIAVAITAELIAARRRVERDLPHMSWFHRHQAESDDGAADASGTANDSSDALDKL